MLSVSFQARVQSPLLLGGCFGKWEKAGPTALSNFQVIAYHFLHHFCFLSHALSLLLLANIFKLIHFFNLKLILKGSCTLIQT